MKIVKAQSPTRVDLAGGTIDLPPLYLFHYPAPTINIAIDIKTQALIRASKKFEIISHDQRLRATFDTLPDTPWKKHPRLELILRIIKSFSPMEKLRVEVSSDVPAGSGLGGSSSLAITLTTTLAAWFKKSMPERELIEYAKSIEMQTIKVPTGYQDYWAAVYGGIHAYEMELNGKLKLTALGSKTFHKELEKHLLLIYVGKPHFSGINNWELFKKHINGDKRTIEFFEKIKENAMLMKKALTKEKINLVAEALNKDWQIRKNMLPQMTTPEIEKLIKETFKNGAFAARACGAGGGGCVLLLIEPEKRNELIQLITKMKMRVLPVKISEIGVRIKTSH